MNLSKVVRRDGRYQLWFTTAEKHETLDAIYKGFRSKPAVFILVGGVGDGPSCDVSKHWFLETLCYLVF